MPFSLPHRDGGENERVSDWIMTIKSGPNDRQCQFSAGRCRNQLKTDQSLCFLHEETTTEKSQALDSRDFFPGNHLPTPPCICRQETMLQIWWHAWLLSFLVTLHTLFSYLCRDFLVAQKNLIGVFGIQEWEWISKLQHCKKNWKSLPREVML